MGGERREERGRAGRREGKIDGKREGGRERVSEVREWDDGDRGRERGREGVGEGGERMGGREREERESRVSCSVRVWCEVSAVWNSRWLINECRLAWGD